MTTSKGSVRIIGGAHRGRRLQFVDQGGDLRPSGDRLRETLFNWLQFDLRGRRVLDLFAGSGVLGAEALSRGAAHAVLVERKAARAADLSRQLKEIFGDQVYIKQADALKFLEHTGGPYDLVFVDPPWHLALSAPACAALEANALLSPEALIYVESNAREPAPAVPRNWQLEKDKISGDARAQLFKRT